MYKILIADRSTSSQIILRGVLKEAGYQVIITDNPYHVNYYICKENPDLLITEVEWPKISSLHYLDTVIRVFNKPIIIHTHIKDMRNIRKYLEIGVTDYLPKPVQGNILLNLMEEYLVHY